MFSFPLDLCFVKGLLNIHSFVEKKYFDNRKFDITVSITAPSLVGVCHLLAHALCHLTGVQHKQVPRV